jgi:hypothetical protein
MIDLIFGVLTLLDEGTLKHDILFNWLRELSNMIYCSIG